MREGNGSAAAEEARKALDAAALAGDLPGGESLVRLALAARLTHQLRTLDPGVRRPIADFLESHPELAAELAFLLSPGDDVAAAYAVLGRLIEAHGERVAELAPLSAAICAVHDQPAPRRINENSAGLIDAVELFGYFDANERSMRFSLRSTPAELLTLIADANGSIEELEWARQRYGRDRNIGNRYQEITYDTRALRQTEVEKRVTASGSYTLQSIRQHGGVCADQAYFAMTVGKALGVPTCSVVGQGGELSHAWLGFLEQTGSRVARWNFSEGRYDDYEDVQGTLLEPQTRRRIPDAFLAIQANSVSAPPDRRREAAALTDTARRVAALARTGAGEPPSPATIARQLDLLEAALRLDAGRLETWTYARSVVASQGSTLAQKERWTQAVDQMAGASNPDFAFEILSPIFAAETDSETRFRLWGWAANRFRSRPDLVARARLEQARVLRDQERLAEAGAAAWAVFQEHHDAGPIAVEALAFAAEVQAAMGRSGEIVGLYEQAWRRVRQPSSVAAAFRRQTTWYQVGAAYAQLLESAGQAREAERVRRRLDQ